MNSNDYAARFSPYSASEDITSPAVLKRDSSEILARDSNRLSIIISLSAAILFLIFALLVSTVFFETVWSLPVVEALYNIWDKTAEGVSYLFTLTAVLPALLGVLTIAGKAVRGEEGRVAHAITAYRRPFRALAVFLIAAAPAALAAAGIRVTKLLCAEIAALESEYAALLYISVFTICLAFFAASLFIFLRGFFFVGLAMRGDLSISRSLRISLNASRGRMRQIAAFILSFTGWAALSVLSIGVLFLLQLAPAFSVSYMLYCERATDLIE